VSDRPVQIIFDSSAIVAFTRGSLDVGEVLHEVGDEEAAAGLPLLCLVHAHPAVTDTGLLELLVAHPATVILAPAGESWRALAVAQQVVGRVDAASAVLDALDADCPILTGQPALYGGLEGEGRIIALS
jgi:hypothetical protein